MRFIKSLNTSLSKNFVAIFAHFKMATTVKILEDKEITGILSPDEYAVLLGSYYVENDLLNAKFLWKRIPVAAKQANLELDRIWKVGQKLWTKDYVGCYGFVKQDWSENIGPIMVQLHQSIRNRLISLISKAYSSVRVDVFAAYTDTNVDEAIVLAIDRGWKYDSVSQMLEPIAETKDVKMTLNNERQLQLLADYVSFLEN